MFAVYNFNYMYDGTVCTFSHFCLFLIFRQTCRQWYSAVITGHDLMSRVGFDNKTFQCPNQINHNILLVIITILL